MKYRFKAMDISKIAILGIFLNYYCFYFITGFRIPNATLILLAVATLGVLVSAYKEPIKFSTDIKCWIGYFLFSVATIPIAYSHKYAIQGLEKYFQRLLLIICIAYICEKEKSIKYGIRLLAITSVACAISTLLTMNSINQKLTLSSGANISTNDIGSIMAFGCFAILFAFGVGEKNRLHKTVLKVSYIIAALVVISVVGSRKSIIAIIIIFVLMFVFSGRDHFKKMTTGQFIGILLIIAVAFLFVYYFLLPSYEDTNLFVRTAGRGAESTAESDEGRINLYLSALSMFWNNLFFGVGYNNFAYIQGLYSHSTYAEPIACSGIFGVVLYLGPYIHMLVNQIKLSFSKKLNQSFKDRTFQKEMLALYIAFLFVGIGIPYLYKDIPCIILAMFVAWQKISFDKLKETGFEIVSEEEKNERITDKSITNNC